MIKKLSDNSKNYIDKYFEIVDNFDRDIRNIERGESISKILIQQILEFYKITKNLSENILIYTTNANIEAFAKMIIKENGVESESLNQMFEYCSKCENDERDILLYLRRFWVVFDGMILKLNNISLTNNLDQYYLSLMLILSEGFIDISKNVLGYDVCENLKMFVENVITVHEMYTSQAMQILRIL